MTGSFSARLKLGVAAAALGVALLGGTAEAAKPIAPNAAACAKSKAATTASAKAKTKAAASSAVACAAPAP